MSPHRQPTAPTPRLHFGTPPADAVAALGGLGYGTPALPGLALSPLRSLAAPVAELWFGSGKVQRAAGGGFESGADGELMFASLRLNDVPDMDAAAFEAYRRIGEFLEHHGYPHLLRVWNYFPRIHDGEGDAERYRQFCVGRHRALSHREGFEQRLCAATVIGADGGDFLIYFLAARVPGRAVENPRQVSAYRYPREHGPKSPSFARATLCGSLLLVSGTASIVGHGTRHAGDAGAQMQEVIANLGSLLAHTGRAHFHGRDGWVARALKLYVRAADDAPRALAALQHFAAGRCAIAVLQGDICRRELVVEVEGVFEMPAAG